MNRPNRLRFHTLALILVAAITSSSRAVADGPRDIAGQWRWDTVVVQGPPGLHGQQARFTAIIGIADDKASVTLLRLERGKPVDLEAPVGIASGLPITVEGDGSRTLNVPVTLRGAQSEPLRFWLRFRGDSVNGYWESRSDAETWGAVFGTRRPGKLRALTLDSKLPCTACCDALYQCGEAGPGSCNSYDSCLSACADDGGRPKKCLRAFE